MDAIEKRKDDLLQDSFKWILDVPEFRGLADDADPGTNDDDVVPPTPCRLLWIKGDAGTGKTMLLIGIIRELSARPASLCPALLEHYRRKVQYKKPTFVTDTDFIGLSQAFENTLRDPSLRPVYFIIDALDECEHGLPDFLSLISKSLTITDKVKWLVSSRPNVQLKNTTQAVVELDTQKLETPVNAYIKHQLSRLDEEDGYTPEITSPSRTRKEMLLTGPMPSIPSGNSHLGFMTFTTTSWKMSKRVM
ncbi:hypothetical protein SCUCBS95973_000965 [Sporothrix curviconia]|uniref:NACHT domain-containing protein n=1 Tax=Sporothrix curviconia TaxID=1260050 RepID=A0ABP0AUL3_9PEZI